MGFSLLFQSHVAQNHELELIERDFVIVINVMSINNRIYLSLFQVDAEPGEGVS